MDKNIANYVVDNNDYPDSWPRIFMWRTMNLNEPDSGFILGEINPAYLWGAGHDNTLPPGVKVCALDDSNNLLFSSLQDTDGLSDQIVLRMKTVNSDVFELIHKERL